MSGRDGPLRARGRLRRRLLVVSALALAASLAVGMLLTFELVLVNERRNLDRALLRQRDHLETDVRDRLAASPGSGDRIADVQDAIADFLALESPTNPYLTVVIVDGARATSPTRSSALELVARDGGLEDGPTNRLVTVHTVAGDLRAARATLLDRDAAIGTLIVAGELGPARGEAFAALRRLGIGGLVGLAVGLVLVWFATRRILGPLSALTATAASTDTSRLGSRVAVEGDDEVALLATEFNAMLARLDQAAAEREQLLATISHELRTPLAVARGSIELAERTAVDNPAAATTALVTARREVDRTTRLVGDLLALGRSGHADFLHRRPIPLATLARELELRIDGLGIDTATVAPADDTPVDVDADRLLQAVLNAVQNAVGHNPAGTTVDVTMALGGAELVICVRDDGAGIAPALRDRILEPFVRGTTGSGGSGLGLAVVAAVATAHGGTVRLLDAQPGTIVELRLPAPRT
jgi:two-component system OmpR family sensor kinase